MTINLFYIFLNLFRGQISFIDLPGYIFPFSYFSSNRLSMSTRRRLKSLNILTINDSIRLFRFRAIRFIRGPYSFLIVFIFIIFLIYVFVYSNEYFISFFTVGNVIEKEIQDIFDKRINNISTLFALSVSIIIFILNSARGNERNQFFLIIDLSYLYPIVYFNIVTILSMVSIIYFNNLFVDRVLFVRLVYLCYFFLFLCIIFIGFIFGKIYFLFDFDRINERLNDYILNLEFFENINDTTSFISYEIYNTSLTDISLLDINSFSRQIHPNYISISFLNERIIRDVDMRRLINTLENYNTEPIYFRRIMLNQTINENVPIFYVPDNFRNNDINNILNCFL